MSLQKPETSSSTGIQKALFVLEILKGLPAGEVIYQQIEQILSDLHMTHAQVERTYYAVVHALLDAYIQHLQPGSPLSVQVRMLQRRLQPPMWSSDLELLKAQVELYADHIIAMQDFDADKFVSALAPLLDTSALTKQNEAAAQPAESTPAETAQAETAPAETGPPLVDRRSHKRRKSDLLPDIEPEITENVGDSLESGIETSISRNQEFGVILDLLASELSEMQDTGDVNTIRERMMDLLGRLRNSHHELIGNLQEARDVLSHIEYDRLKLDQELQRARTLSLTDELTELPNRRAFLDRLKDEVGRVQRHNMPLSLAIIDLDEFKNINDIHGHNVGDQVLKCYAEHVFSLFRQYDMVARYGGEEFAVLLPNTDREGAMCALRKARDKVRGILCQYQENDIPLPSFSAGVAVYHEGEDPDRYIGRADQALYRAKSLGRNRVELALS
jgi:diguanylate cyclase (GGDEF)-like protein